MKSAMEIAANIDTERYEPVYVGITRSGGWWTCARPCTTWQDGAGRRVVISPDRQTHGLVVVDGGRCHAVRVDVVFPVLHGRAGEDGAVQGLLEMSGIPYVGCGIGSSAVCMDKSMAYIVAGHAGIDTPEVTVLRGAWTPVPRDLAYPVFVKPARSGSSFGVRKVDGADELDAAIEAARRYDTKVLIEQAIVGTEVGCAVLGNGNELIVGEVDRIRLRHGLFRIHQEAEPEKGSENAEIMVPADLADRERDRVRATATSIYEALGCEGLARVDMFLQEDGRIVLNEVNTMPGFTAYSRYPRMMTAAGISLSDVIDRCISLALQR